jgi:hypothetical protein
MVQTYAITDAIDSLGQVESRFGVSPTSEPDFFREWQGALPQLNAGEEQRLDLIKERYLRHRKYGHLLEGAVNFIVIAPLLEMAGFYDHPFQLRSEASVRIEIPDEENRIYQGRIDSLIVQEQLWVVLVEAKRTSFSVEVALPQAIAYIAASPHPQRASYALVSNGGYSMFIKLERGQYAFSDDFSLNRTRNELYDVLRVLNQLKGLME